MRSDPYITGMQRSGKSWLRLPLVFVAACLAHGCGEPKATLQSHSVKQDTTVAAPPESGESPAAEPIPPETARRRVVVVPGRSRLHPELVHRALSQALRDNGFEVLKHSDLPRADMILVVVCDAQATTPWGGIPCEKVWLRYTVMGPRRQTIKAGQDWATHADPVRETADLEALNRVSRSVARTLTALAAQLPPTIPSRGQQAPPRPASTPQLRSLACLPFRNKTGRADLDGWCESLASIAVQEFKRAEAYRIVERARLGEILKEDDIAAAIDSSPDAVEKVAERLGVDLLLVGEVAFRPNGDLAISGRVVTAKQAEVQQAIYVAGPVRRVDQVEQAFRQELLRPVRPVPDWIATQLRRLEATPTK
ncbi:MAG: hypothetical protein JXQ73_29730 [Phycisphaerae bacterium]|nr:hypothetical protein [Phycisphaerae bacterium]